MARSLDADHQPHRTSSLTEDLLALWRLNEATAASNATDAGPSGRTLTQNGSPGVVQSLVKDIYSSGARSFDGATQWLAQSAAGTIHASFANDWTVMLWCAVIDNGNDMALIQYGDAFAGSNVNMSVEVNSSLGIRVFWEHTAGTDVITDTDANVWGDNETFHLAVVKKADPLNHDKVMLEIYKNGVLIKIAHNLTNTNGGSNCRFILGGSFDAGSLAAPGRLLEGTLDDVVVLPFAADRAMVRDGYARGAREFDETALSKNQFRSVHYRVLVEDKFGAIDEGAEAGTLVDMTNLMGWCWLHSAQITSDADDDADTAKVTFFPRIGEFNLGMFAKRSTAAGVEVYDNPLATANGANSYSFMTINARIVIEAAVVPYGTSREGAEPFFDVKFDGFISAFSPDDDRVDVECIDRIKGLQDQWIEPDNNGEDRAYGSSIGVAVEGELQQVIDDNDPSIYSLLSIDDSGGGGTIVVTLFSLASVDYGSGKPHLLQAGDKVKITGTVNYNGIFTVASTTANGFTTVETSGGAFAAETAGTVQTLPEKGYIGGKPTLWVPTSPSWNVFEWVTTSTQNVAQHLFDVISQIGWTCRYAWDDYRQQFRLKLFRPDPSSQGASHEAVCVIKNKSAKQEGYRTRNIVVVEYEDASSTAPVGDRKRKVKVATFPSSAKQFGRQYARIGVGSTSRVNTATEAQDLADRVLLDLKADEPEVEYEVMLDQVTETGDYFTIKGEQGTSGLTPERWLMPAHRPVDKIFGLLSRTHSFGPDGCSTTLKGRGNQTPHAFKKIFDMVQANGWLKGRGTKAPASSAAPRFFNMDGRFIVQWDKPVGDLNAAYLETEIHMSKTSGFTPTSLTLVGVSSTNEFSVSALEAAGSKPFDDGTQYYVKLVHRDRMRNRAVPTAEASAQLGRIAAINQAPETLLAPLGLMPMATFTLAADVAYFVYVGKTVRDVSVARVYAFVTSAGVGAGDNEYGIFSSTSGPSRASLTLTRIASGTADAVTSTGIKRSGALTAVIPAGTHLWAAWRTNLATTQPTMAGLGMDMGDGRILTSTGTLAATTHTGTVPAISTAALAPSLRVEVS